MWPERLAITAVFLLVTAITVASNLERAPADRHSWFAAFSPLIVLQAVFFALLLAGCVALARDPRGPLVAIAGTGPPGLSDDDMRYATAASIRAEAAARRRRAAAAPDAVWGTLFLVLFVLWTVLLACKLNAVDDAAELGGTQPAVGGPSWGVVFALALALELLLLVFLAAAAVRNCLARAEGDADDGAAGAGCAGSLADCKCAQPLRSTGDGQFDGLDVVHELLLYLLLTSLVVTTAMWLVRLEHPGDGQLGMGVIFTPLFVSLGLLLIHSGFLVARLVARRDLCYDWSVTLLYIAALALSVVFLRLFAAALDDPSPERSWHAAFAPLYALFSLTAITLCTVVVSCGRVRRPDASSFGVIARAGEGHVPDDDNEPGGGPSLGLPAEDGEFYEV